VKATPERLDVRDLLPLVAAEYSSVRQEWLDSAQAQQTTFQWTLAAAALIIGAILTGDVRGSEQFLYLLGALTLYALTVASSAIFIGALLRQERAALYLRGREESLAALAGTSLVPSPLLFERFRGYKPASKTPWIPKSTSTVIGGSFIYCTLGAFALALLFDAWLREPHTSENGRLAAAVLFIAASLIAILYGRWVKATLVSLRDYSGLSADLAVIDLKPVRDSGESEPLSTCGRPSGQVP
jgi:hypothetical protein